MGISLGTICVVGGAVALYWARRQHRRWAVWVSRMIIGFGVVVLLAGSWFSPLGCRLNPLKPLAILEWEVTLKDPGTARAAATELVERIVSHQTTHEELSSTLGVILAEQADKSRPWDPAKGDVVEAAKTTGILTPAEWEAYATHVLGWSFEARPRLRLGDDWPTHSTTLPCRGGSDRFGFFFASNGQLEGRIATWTYLPQPNTIDAMAASGSGGYEGFAVIKGAGLEGVINPGQYTATLVLHCETTVGRAVFHHLQAYEIPLTVLPKTTSSLDVISRPELADAMQKALRARVQIESDGRCALSVDAAPTPVDGVFSAFVWDGQREWAFSCCDTSKRWRVSNVSTVFGDERTTFRPGQQLELRLRPDLRRAAMKVDALEIWGEEIRLPCSVGEIRGGK